MTGSFAVRFALLVAVAALHAAPATAQSPAVREASPGLAKRAKVSSAAATTAALRRVPGGVVQSVEREEEKGKLIYSFDIKVRGRRGIEEVGVDAVTGDVLSVEHETPSAEAKEARNDRAAARMHPKPKLAAKRR